MNSFLGTTPLDSLGVWPKWNSQDQVTVLDSRLSHKDTPSSLNIYVVLNPHVCERWQHVQWIQTQRLAQHCERKLL